MPRLPVSKRTHLPFAVHTRLLLAALLFGTMACAEPDGVAAQGTQIDGATLMRDISVLAHDSMQGRLVGSEEGAAARRWISARLTQMGLSPQDQPFEARQGVQGTNVIAQIPGSGGASGRIVLTAHYDHLGVRGDQIFNGADDNASGTAGVLAIASVLAQAPLAHDVTVILFDGEEGGLRGARAYVASLESEGRLEEVALNVNLDMVSRSEESLWVTGTYQHPALRPVIESIQPVPGVVVRFGHDTPSDTGSDNWVSASDHGPFHAAGLPFLYFGVEDHPDYHRPTDDVEKVDPEWYAGSIETILRALRALDASLLQR